MANYKQFAETVCLQIVFDYSQPDDGRLDTKLCGVGCCAIKEDRACAAFNHLITWNLWKILTDPFFLG